ncbi:hypothetical protein GOODEAATRI_027359 [Goodea atripinnis]|uniref:Uncharacterized protein n=1 Tax=Goodea atripinnis TaxID=208336 RepID=A0ABV0ML47_9TELE
MSSVARTYPENRRREASSHLEFLCIVEADVYRWDHPGLEQGAQDPTGHGSTGRAPTGSEPSETDSPVKEDRLDQSDHVSAGVVTGTNTRYMDQLQKHKTRVSGFTKMLPDVPSNHPELHVFGGLTSIFSLLQPVHPTRLCSVSISLP